MFRLNEEIGHGLFDPRDLAILPQLLQQLSELDAAGAELPDQAVVDMFARIRAS